MSQTLDLARGRHKEVYLHLLVGWLFLVVPSHHNRGALRRLPTLHSLFSIGKTLSTRPQRIIECFKRFKHNLRHLSRNFSQIDSVYFDPMNVEIYDDSSNQSHSIASSSFPKFTLKKKSHVEDNRTVNATGLDFDAARQEIAARGFKQFKMNLEASVRYPAFLVFKTRRHRYRKSADVKIDALGVYSAATKHGNNFVGVGVLVMLYLLGLFFVRSN